MGVFDGGTSGAFPHTDNPMKGYSWQLNLVYGR